MAIKNFQDLLFDNIFNEYKSSNTAFKNTLLDLEENKKIKIFYEKFMNDESEPNDININLEVIHIQNGVIKMDIEREEVNYIINDATKKVCNYLTDNKKPSNFEDTKRYLLNMFSENDIIVKITDEAVIYLSAVLEE
jgi:predicted DNA-binding protein (UPF0251 family)